MIRSLLIYCFLLIAFLSPRAIHAQQVFKTTTKSVIGYLEYLPDGYKSSTSDYPVVIFLHGRGEKGPNSTNPKTLEQGVPLLTKLGPPKHVKNGTRFPFILISPQLKSGYGGWPTSYVMEVIEHVQKTLRIDNKRIYITGLSMGGFGTWSMIQQYPHLFAAAAPVCGGGSTSKAKAIADENLPVWAFHGDADRVVSVSKSIDMVNAINSYNPNPKAKLSIYKGVKHDAWNNAYQPDNSVHNPNVYQWMMSHRNGNPAPAENNAPVADAGSDKTISASLDKYVISGSGKDSDGKVSSYEWSKESGGSIKLSNADSKELTISEFEPGTYRFKLTVTDDKGAKDSDEVKITVEAASNPPVADAGSDKTIQLPQNSLTLKGEGKTEDGKITKFSWSKISGGDANLSGESTSELTVKALKEGEYTFRLKVETDKGLSDTDDVVVKVLKAVTNKAPIVDAGDDETIESTLEKHVLAGSARDEDGTVAVWEWTKVSGGDVKMSGKDKKDLTISEFAEGKYVFRLTVTDDKGASASDEATITIEKGARPPVAYAGDDKVIKLPQTSVTLKGEGKSEDGKITGYSWTKVSGEDATLSGENTPELVAKGLKAGEYKFRLKVVSENGLSDTDDVVVTVNKADPNKAPVANAGKDETLESTLAQHVISGSGKDEDGTVTSWEWSKVSGGDLKMSGKDKKDLTISEFTEGEYVFRLTVTDDKGASASDEVTITIEKGARPPVAYAGDDKVIKLPQTSVTLKGEGKSEDGKITGYSWTKLSGEDVSLSGENTPELAVKGLKAGEYKFRLKVENENGLTDTDEVVVTVNKADPNKAPVANAGPDKTINASVESFTITGSGKDSDGTITSFQWSKVSGGDVTMSGSNKKDLKISGYRKGEYVFRLTVIDNHGDKDQDDVLITVESAHKPPVAIAGNDRSIQLPQNSVTLKGAGQVEGGTIAKFAWSKLSGGNALLSGESTAELSARNLTEGEYVFRLTVTSDKGLSDTDDVKITVVKASENRPPVADAGPDRRIKSSEKALTVSGSGEDPDGSIKSYTWAKVSGGSVNLDGASTADLKISDFQAGSFIFRLTVKDDRGASDDDDVLIIVEAEKKASAPVVDAGDDKSLQLPNNKVTLKGQATVDGAKITGYQWQKISGGYATLAGQKTSTVTVSDLKDGVYVFRLNAQSDNGLSGSDEVTITVKKEIKNIPPVANAGPDRKVEYTAAGLILSGSGVDEDGSVKSFAWKKISGGEVTLTNADKKDLILTGLKTGKYVFRLTVIDDQNASHSDDVLVQVTEGEEPENPEPHRNPVAYAGNDRIIRLPENVVVIRGGATADGRRIAGYEWRKKSGGTVGMSGQKNQTLTVSHLRPGEYVFELKVTCEKGLTGFDEIKITVKEALKMPEKRQLLEVVANGGPDVTVSLPVERVILNGSGSSKHGKIVAYHWEQVGGLPLKLNNADQQKLMITGFSAAGIRTFKLTVRDNTGRQAVDHVSVIVENQESPITENETANPSDGEDLVDRPASEQLGQFDLTAGRVPQLQEFDVAVFNDAGKMIFMGRWDADAYHRVFRDPGLYIYHILANGRKVRVGKIMIQP